MSVDLPIIWAVIILFGVLMYVLTDRFDLGIGIQTAGDPDRRVLSDADLVLRRKRAKNELGAKPSEC